MGGLDPLHIDDFILVHNSKVYGFIGLLIQFFQIGPNGFTQIQVAEIGISKGKPF